MVHPRAVTTIKIGGQAVPEDVMRSVLGFILLYLGLFGIACILLAAAGVDWCSCRLYRQYRTGVRCGGTGGKLCPDSCDGQVAADLVHVAGTP